MIHNLAFSGGVDSSLLLYLLAEQASDGIIINTRTIDVKRRPAVKMQVEKIIEFILNEFPNATILSSFKEIPNELDLSQKEFQKAKAILSKEYFKGCLSGITNQMPKDYYIGRYHPKSDMTYAEDAVMSLRKNIKGVYANMDKRDIALIYKERGLLQTLFPLTISCTFPINLTDPCNKCIGCKETYAAFYDYLYK